MSSELDVARQMDFEQNGEGFNGNVLTTSELLHSGPVKEGRIIRKAKRLTKPGHSPKKSDDQASTTNGNNNKVLCTKNMRKSRNGKGRGLPKKGEKSTI